MYCVRSRFCIVLTYETILQDINLRLVTLPPPRSLAAFPVHLQNPLPLPQLSNLLNLLNQALDIIDISAWTGDPHNGSFIAGQLKLLADTVEEARQILKGGEDIVGGKWWEDVATDDVRPQLCVAPRAQAFPNTQLDLQPCLTPKSLLPPIHRRCRPHSPHPHPLPDINPRTLPHRPLPPHPPRPRRPPPCPRRTRSSLHVSWRRSQCEGEGES